jgi:hypothetical protein
MLALSALLRGGAMKRDINLTLIAICALATALTASWPALASPGCTALKGSNKGMAVTGSHIGAGGFAKGDTLLINVLDSTITMILWDDTTNTRIKTFGNGSFRYVIPAATSDTLMVEFELSSPFNGSASWSCSPAGSSSGGSNRSSIG